MIPSDLPWAEPSSPPPSFKDSIDGEEESYFQYNFPIETAPKYSHYASINGSGFELQPLGRIIKTKEKYQCGDLLDDRYFLLGTSMGLECIDLSMPPDQQVPKRLIEFVSFFQIQILPAGGCLLCLAGKNRHMRTYGLESLRLLILSKLRPQLLQKSTLQVHSRNHGRAKSMDYAFQDDTSSVSSISTARHSTELGLNLQIPELPLRRIFSLDNLDSSDSPFLPNTPVPSRNETKENYNDDNDVSHLLSTDLHTIPNPSSISQSVVDLISSMTPNSLSCDSSLSFGSSPLSSTNSIRTTTDRLRGHGRHASHSSPLNPSSANKSLRDLPIQCTLDYIKLPGTRMSLSFTIRSGPARTYLAVLSKQNIFLFEVDYGNTTRRPEFVHTRTYWLPQTPKFLEMSIHGDNLIDIIAIFQQEIILIGVEDSRIREVAIDSLLRPIDNDSSSVDKPPTWETFQQLPFLPIIDPKYVAESFTIPPPYNLIIKEDPTTMLNPIPIFESGSIDSLEGTGAPSLFFATFGSKSLIVDGKKGQPFFTLVFEWSIPPQHVEFINAAEEGGESFVVGFGKNMVEVRSFNTGRLIESVVRGVHVQFLASGRDHREVLWSCAFDRGTKGVCLYRLEGPHQI